MIEICLLLWDVSSSLTCPKFNVLCACPPDVAAGVAKQQQSDGEQSQQSVEVVERRTAAVDGKGVRLSHQSASHLCRAQLHASDHLPALQEAPARPLPPRPPVQRSASVSLPG